MATMITYQESGSPVEVEDGAVIVINCAQAEREQQIDWCLTNVRRIYSHIPAALISDGGTYVHYALAKRHMLEHVRGKACKNVRYGAQWVERMLQTGLDLARRNGRSFIWKIDPDTFVRRRFSSSIPSGDYIGHSHGKDVRHIQGGCVLISTRLAASMLRVLERTKSFERFDGWIPNDLGKVVRDWAIRTGWLSSDFISLKLLNELNVIGTDWPEVYSVCGLTKMPDNIDRFAVVHPWRV